MLQLVSDAKVSRRDPTRSTAERARLDTFSRRAVMQWRNDVHHEVVGQDALGIHRVSMHTLQPRDRLDRFLGFLRASAARRIAPLEDVFKTVIGDVYVRGYRDGTKEMGSKTSGAMNAGVYKTLAATELRGVMETSLQAAARTAAESSTAEESPQQFFARLAKPVFKDIAFRRFTLTGQTLITMAYNGGKLDAYQHAGLTGVEILPETVPTVHVHDAVRSSRRTYVNILTAGDDRVCNRCEDLAGRTYSLAAARGLLPAHPNCRCVVVPATDRRFAAPELER